MVGSFYVFISFNRFIQLICSNTLIQDHNKSSVKGNSLNCSLKRFVRNTDSFRNETSLHCCVEMRKAALLLCLDLHCQYCIYKFKLPNIDLCCVKAMSHSQSCCFFQNVFQLSARGHSAILLFFLLF